MRPQGGKASVGSGVAARTSFDQLHAELVGRYRMTCSATDFHRSLGAAIQVSETQSVVAGQVTPPPLEYREHHRHEIDAGRGEHVFVAGALARLTVWPPRQ